ncbi:MAG: hypothetical protein LAQ30_13920 [Acidobacteriia bacterium]|nr:hypothetical protein [Terriglobia bacterium]
MTMDAVWFRFLAAVLATWRVTHLLAREDGPWDLIVRIRKRLGSGVAGKLADCPYCLSLWVAAPLAWFVTSRWGEAPVVWLALSGGTCLLEKATSREQAVVIQPLAESGERDERDAVLRTETNGSR